MKRTMTIVVCFTILIVLLYGVFSLTIFGTSAKYTDYKELNHFFESQEMYISSNKLSYQNNKYNIINYYNFHPIEINLTNSINDNQITKYDIEYTLECNILDNQDKSYNCLIDNGENNIVTSTLISTKECLENKNLTEEECINSGYNFDVVKSTNKHTFKIINNKGNSKTIKAELILNTISPYSKQLKATYILNVGNNQNNGIIIDEVKEYNSFCEYNILNNYYTDKNIKLTIDSNKLLFDTTSNIYNNKLAYTIDSNNQIDTITFTLSNNIRIKLYKKNFTYKCSSNEINLTILE